MTTIIDGSNGVTFPNGTNPQAAPCKVLQVVQNSTSTSSSTTGNTFVASNLNASITPLFSNSKILILINGGDIDNSISGNQGFCTVYRNSTPLNSTGLCDAYGASSRVIVPISINYLDSPATTSSITYTMYFKGGNSSQTITVIGQGASATITLLEIAA